MRIFFLRLIMHYLLLANQVIMGNELIFNGLPLPLLLVLMLVLKGEWLPSFMKSVERAIVELLTVSTTVSPESLMIFTTSPCVMLVMSLSLTRMMRSPILSCPLSAGLLGIILPI
jgi:hypothetical protein